jgi:hypothetical protein
MTHKQVQTMMQKYPRVCNQSTSSNISFVHGSMFLQTRDHSL